jgi:LysM repeat protein
LYGNQIYDVEVKPVILERNIVNSKAMFQGELAIKFIYSTNQTCGIATKEMKIPFDYEMQVANITMSTNISTEIEVTSQDFIVGTDGMIEARVDLYFILDVSNTLSINIIDEVNIDETRNKEIYSMVIYFVKSGDTLWNIAKRFGSTVCDIVRVNKIEDENKIYPGQQLFIPKYVFTRKEETA